jgi:hypothetical protein
MSRFLATWALSGLFCWAGGADAGSVAPMKVGEKVESLTFKDIRYLNRSLTDLEASKGYCLVFLSTECPIAQRYLPRLKELDAEFSPKGVQFVGLYPSQDESMLDVSSHALEAKLPFAIVRDVNQKCAKTLGIDRVPMVVVLNANKELVYRGRIDDQYRFGGATPKVGRHDLAEALGELVAKKAISVAETPVEGCKLSPWSTPSFDFPVTFHENVEKIMQQRCQNCHHDGAATPFSLVTYDDVKNQGEMIAEVVTDQRMPPWYATPKYGHFQNDPSLSKEERDLVSAWVQAGMPAGDPAKAPAPLSFPKTEWRIGEPDLVVTMKQTHKVQAEGFVPYNYVILPYVFKEDTYVNAIEIRPHNRACVHHCNMAYVNLLQGKGGRESFITGYVPGGQPMILESAEDIAYKIPKGSSLVLQIHYTTTGKPEKSQISVGFRYAKRVQKTTHFFVLDPRGFGIEPGNALFELEETKVIPKNATLLGMFCHMHVRGRDMTFTAEYPDGKAETLLQIPNYNFEWQLGYECPTPPNQTKIPAGTKIRAVAHYDNSKFNPYNPDPNREVPYGDQTYDEMFNGFVFWVYDDEELNLTIDPKTGQVVKEGVAIR